MKFRIRCEGRTRVVEIENNDLTTVNDLKATILTSAPAHLSSDVHLSLNGRTPLEDDSTLSDAGLVHGDTIYVMAPSGAASDICPSSSSSTSQQTNGGPSHSASASSSEVDGSSSTQSADSHSDCNLDKGGSETMMVCTEAVQDDTAMQTDEPIADVEVSIEVNRYLMEPMLIRESTADSLPRSLVKFYDELKAPGSHRAVAVVLKVLMNELGYLEQDKAATGIDIRNWTDPKSLQMNFVYPVLDATTFSLLLVPMYGTLMVHGRAELFNGETLNARIQVVVSDFVNDCTLSDGPCAAFHGKRLPSLSRTFKDTIAYPLLQLALAGSGFCAKPGLSSLALELQMEIMKRLDIASLLSLSQVCHQLHDAAQDRSVWRHIFIKDFGASHISAKDLTEDWNTMYKKRYSHVKAMKRSAVMAPFWRPQLPSFPPIVPVGGDYDINPFFPAPRPPMCMGGPVMFPFANGSSLDSSLERFDECLLSSGVHPTFRYGHPGGPKGGPFCFRF